MLLQQDRARLAKEKQLKEEAIRDKEDMERKYIQLQDEVRKAQEELVCCHGTSYSKASMLFCEFHPSFL